jgi:hypothetical protein
VASSASAWALALPWLGGVLLSARLVALLVAVSEGATWHWGSASTIGQFILSALLAAALGQVGEPRAAVARRHETMQLQGVWTTNTAALLLGFGQHSALILIPQLVQAPTSTGYGYGASVSQAGLFLVPTTIASMITSPIGGRLSNLVGSKVPLVLGSIFTTIADRRRHRGQHSRRAPARERRTRCSWTQTTTGQPHRACASSRGRRSSRRPTVSPGRRRRLRRGRVSPR